MTDHSEAGPRSALPPAARQAGKADEEPGQSTAGTSPGPEPTERPFSLFERIAGLFRQRNGPTLREDIAEALAEADQAAEEAFSPNERAMLSNILRLREVRVEDVMVPRADINAAELNTTLGELMELFEKTGNSRMPVHAGNLDDPRGMIHIRDVLGHITRSARRKQSGEQGAIDLASVDLSRPIGELELMRELLFVPPSMLAAELMTRMQNSRTQMALVIDEYGGTDGLVSLEDIVETVVGDIEDEHDEDEDLIDAAEQGVFVVDGKAEIEDVTAAIGSDFVVGEHGEYVDTIGGLVLNTVGRVPHRGEVIEAVPGFEFQVLDADPRRVKRVRIVRKERPPVAAAG